MEEISSTRIEDLKTSLERIRTCLEWNRPSHQESGSLIGAPILRDLSDLKSEIGRFYRLYDDLKEDIQKASGPGEKQLLEKINGLWTEYFLLVRNHPEIFRA